MPTDQHGLRADADGLVPKARTLATVLRRSVQAAPNAFSKPGNWLGIVRQDVSRR